MRFSQVWLRVPPAAVLFLSTRRELFLTADCKSVVYKQVRWPTRGSIPPAPSRSRSQVADMPASTRRRECARGQLTGEQTQSIPEAPRAVATRVRYRFPNDS